MIITILKWDVGKEVAWNGIGFKVKLEWDLSTFSGESGHSVGLSFCDGSLDLLVVLLQNEVIHAEAYVL